MSRWTHVAGVIRVDAIRVLDGSNELLIKKIKDIIGEPKNYEEIDWDENGKCNTTIPHGSEGSLDYKINLNSEFHSMAAGVVTIYGDLRDVGGDEDVENIRKWFFNVCDELFVRQAVIQIFDGFDDFQTFNYERRKKNELF